MAVNITFLFQRIKGITLDSTVGELLDKLPLVGDFRSVDLVSYPIDGLPYEFSTAPVRDLFYIDDPVWALTTRKYLRDADKSLRISHLLTNSDDGFYPVNSGRILVFKPR